MTGVHIRRQPCENMETQGKWHVIVKTEVEVRQVQAEEHQGLLANDQKLARSIKSFAYRFQRVHGLWTP